MDVVFQEAFGGEVFSEAAWRKIAAGEFLFPVGVVLDGIAVDGFVLAAVDGKVGLAVAVEIEFAECNGVFDGTFVDPGGYGVPCQITSRGRPTFRETMRTPELRPVRGIGCAERTCDAGKMSALPLEIQGPALFRGG